MFSAALTPSNTAASIKTIEVISKESWRINHLWENTRQMITGLNNIGIDTGNSETPVVPVMVGTNEKALSLAKYLFDNGFIANAVVYPAVPLNRARLRLCCTAAHTPEIISRFVKKIGDFF